MPVSRTSPAQRARRFRAGIGLLLLAVLAAACVRPGVTLLTNSVLYRVGDAGRAVVTNARPRTVYLPGCPALVYEKWQDGAWHEAGTTAVCVWEGLAQPLEPGEQASYDFTALEPGVWRLRSQIGFGCDPSAPLNEANCARVSALVSNEFKVRASACIVTGCSGQLCAAEPIATTCEWRPEYACYQDANCGNFGLDGGCAWEPTPELEACLESF